MHNFFSAWLPIPLNFYSTGSGIFLYSFLYLLDRCSLRTIAAPLYVVVVPDKMLPLLVGFHLYRLPPFSDRLIEQNGIIFLCIIIPQFLKFRKGFRQSFAAVQYLLDFGILFLIADQMMAPLMCKTPLCRAVCAAERAEVFIRHGRAERRFCFIKVELLVIPLPLPVLPGSEKPPETAGKRPFFGVCIFLSFR